MCPMRFFYFYILINFAFLYSTPTGEKILSGKFDIHRKNKELIISQKDPKGIIEWDHFTINKGEITRFNQLSKDCAVLNRVVGKDLSKIYGKLESNGKVFLLNEKGILISKDAIIDVGSFIASTLNLTDQCFLEENTLNFSGDSKESVINLGKISASDDIYLISRKVENKGYLRCERDSRIN